MKPMMLALAAAATLLPLATPALAQRDWQDRNGQWHRYGEWQDRNGRWHTNNGRWVRDTNVRNWSRYDWNNPDGDGWYYADRYYRTGSYRPVVVTRTTRIYRGNDNRYYCRRSDGTTGLIVGASLGGVIGNRLDRGRSSVLGTLLGAGIGAALGSEIDRGQVVCR